MSHQEKQRIFDEYAKSKGFESWQNLLHKAPVNELPNHTFAACDLVQEEQQKRIAENARMNFHDGHFKSNCRLKYFQSGADNLTVDKSSITNPKNKIN